MDADLGDAHEAERIQSELGEHAEAVMIDLAPDREDGYDLTDWLQANLASLLQELR